MFALLTAFMLAAPALIDPASQFVHVPQDVIDALNGYRISIWRHCVTRDPIEQKISTSSMRQRRSVFGRDLAAMRSYYKTDFVEHGPVLVTAPPPFCGTPEEFKSDEASEDSALDRLTGTLIDHGVLSIPQEKRAE